MTKGKYQKQRLKINKKEQIKIKATSAVSEPATNGLKQLKTLR